MFEVGSVKTAQCPECDGLVTVDRRAKLGDSLECPECGTMLEVISLHPLELDYALDYEDWEEEWEEEDWEEEDWDEE